MIRDPGRYMYLDYEDKFGNRVVGNEDVAVSCEALQYFRPDQAPWESAMRETYGYPVRTILQPAGGRFQVSLNEFTSAGETAFRCSYMRKGGLAARFYDWVMPAMPGDTPTFEYVASLNMYYHPTGLLGTNDTSKYSHLDLASAIVDGAIMVDFDGLYNLYLKCSDSAKLLIYGQYSYLSLASSHSIEFKTTERIPMRKGVPLEIQIQFML